MKEDKCCGNCCWFYGEMTEGDGFCPFLFAEIRNCEQECNKQEEFISKEQMRYYLAVLTQHNRWRRSNNVPNHCRMVNPTELGKAIDFAVKYVKVFSNL